MNNNIKKIISFLAQVSIEPEMIENSFLVECIHELQKYTIQNRNINIRRILPIETIKKVRSVNWAYETYLEVDSVINSLSGSEKLNFAKAHLSRDGISAITEGEAAAFQDGSNIAFVGSGAFPSTAISYSQTFPIPVTCIDYSYEASFLSTQLINRLNLEDKIRVIYSQGEDVNYEKFSHIAISAMSQNRPQILRRIEETATLGTKVTVRVPTAVSILLYEELNYNLEDSDFQQDKRVTHENNTYNTLILTLNK